MEFDPSKAREMARAISRPRLVGSGEDERVAAEIAETLGLFGYKVEREPFQFTRAFDIALAVEILIALLLVIASFILSYWLVVIGISLLALLVIAQPLNRFLHNHAVAPDPMDGATDSALRTFALGLGRRYRSANIIATPRGGHKDGLPHLYLMAHSDSKSQLLPLAARMAFIILFLVSVVLFALSALLSSPSIMLAVVIALAGLPLVFNGIGNKSPGANDNASGTGVVLQLAEVLKSRPELLAKFNLTILITSAEELGTMGSLYHVQKHLAALRQSNVKILNFDSIGIEGRLSLAGAKAEQSLVELAEQAAEQKDIALSKFNLIGALYDHIPFIEQGLEAVTFVTVGGAAWSIHTAADTPDKLYWRGFERAGKVALRMIEMIGDGS